MRRLLSDDQKALADDLLLGLDGLTLLGPVRAWKWDQGAGELPDQVAAELWEVDEHLRFLELSAREEEDPLGEQRRLDQVLQAHDLSVDPDQQTKTSAVLAHLAAAEVARG